MFRVLGIYNFGWQSPLKLNQVLLTKGLIQSFNPEPKVYVPNRFALVTTDQCLLFLYLNFFLQNWQIVLVDGT